MSKFGCHHAPSDRRQNLDRRGFGGELPWLSVPDPHGGGSASGPRFVGMSPIALSSDLVSGLARIGPVAHLVSPNRLHHLFLHQWQDRYPQPQLWGLASTVVKRPDLVFKPALTDEPPPEWKARLIKLGFAARLCWTKSSSSIRRRALRYLPTRTGLQRRVFASQVETMAKNVGAARRRHNANGPGSCAARMAALFLQARTRTVGEMQGSCLGCRTSRRGARGVSEARPIMFIRRSLSWLHDVKEERLRS